MKDSEFPCFAIKRSFKVFGFKMIKRFRILLLNDKNKKQIHNLIRYKILNSKRESPQCAMTTKYKKKNNNYNKKKKR